jgi:hypothetical protein
VHPSRTSRSPFPAAPRQPDPLITAAPAADALPTIEAPVTDWCAHVSKICERLRQASSADDIAFWDTAMRRAAQGYLHRAFQPVRCKEDLLTHGHLAMCFAWHGCTNAVSRLAQEFASLDVRLAEFDVVNADLLCDLACAYAQGGASNQHVTRAMRELADEVHHRLKGDQHYFCLSNVDRLLAALTRAIKLRPEQFVSWNDCSRRRSHGRQDHRQGRKIRHAGRCGKRLPTAAANATATKACRQ